MIDMLVLSPVVVETSSVIRSHIFTLLQNIDRKASYLKNKTWEVDWLLQRFSRAIVCAIL